MDKLKALYWWLAGKKTTIGAALAVALLAIHQLGLSTSWDNGFQIAANALMVVGLLDKAWRSDAVAIPESWKSLYAIAVKSAPITGLVLGYAVDWLHTAYCGVTVNCPQWVHVIDRVCYLASGLGLVGTVNLAGGPKYAGPERRA